jgi:hypothetical protein
MADDPLGSMVNWTLKAGAHESPGPDGGTCVTEAAVVAAGLAYRRIEKADDCPPCFSRPLAAYAIGINDFMADQVRQRLLLPFVTRLSGTADRPEVEERRAEYIGLETVRRVLAGMCDGLGLKMEADRCRAADSLEAALDAADRVRSRAIAVRSEALDDAARCAARGVRMNLGLIVAGKQAAMAAGYIYTHLWNLAVCETAVQILEDALRIGGEGGGVDFALAARRLEAARPKRELAAA